MNTALVDYGIHTEGSHIRAHVCIASKRLYVFPTIEGVRLVMHRNPQWRRPAYQGNIQTADGYAVPVTEFRELLWRPLPPFIVDAFKEPRVALFLGAKGNLAVTTVQYFLMTGQFPLVMSGSVVTDRNMQVQGTDIIINLSTKIQVKCDWKGGHQEAGGSGNLYLQIAECNPYRIY